MKKQQAFTMIELLVVATILIILTTLALVSFKQANISVRNAKRKADLETMRQAMSLYKQDHGFYATAATPSFESLANFLHTEGFLSEAVLQDPKNSGIYVYQATCTATSAGNCVSGTLQAVLEPDGTIYELTAL